MPLASPLTAQDLAVNRVYAAKKPAIRVAGFVNDRQILWISAGRTQVQYDSPTIPNGQHYKRCSIEEFLEWAGDDVTAKMPDDGCWRQSL